MSHSSLLDAVKTSVEQADADGANVAHIDKQDLRTVLELLQSVLAAGQLNNRPPDPFDAAAVRGAMDGLSRIQQELRPDRAKPAHTIRRLGMLHSLLENGVTVEQVASAWRWFLREVDDRYKGNWMDTFLHPDKFAGYLEASASKPTNGKPKPRVFVPPPLPDAEDSRQAGEQLTAYLMSKGYKR